MSSSAVDMSANGQVVVGIYSYSYLLQQPVGFHWDGTTLTDITTDGLVRAVSADGSVAIGSDYALNEAFIWTAVDGRTGIGRLPGGAWSGAEGVSANGNVVVGRSENVDGATEAFHWSQIGGMVGLGDLPGGDVFSVAMDATADGSIVVGYSDVDGTGGI